MFFAETVGTVGTDHILNDLTCLQSVPTFLEMETDFKPQMPVGLPIRTPRGLDRNGTDS